MAIQEPHGPRDRRMRARPPPVSWLLMPHHIPQGPYICTLLTTGPVAFGAPLHHSVHALHTLQVLSARLLELMALHHSTQNVLKLLLWQAS